ncbi:MAG: tetratricopeptide repeat protein [Proteobacteria bacterium]|nr:tetratricopeptide repeat protein [Pseudomonadota bacterium]MBU1687913.1 tetratricopeptide repeat protein [Pseudomonadota bacterium]
MKVKILVPVIFLVALLGLASFPLCAEEVSHYAGMEVEKGREFFKNGDFDAALGRFNQAIILDPGYAPAYYGSAQVYGARNQMSQAIHYFRKTIELADPPMVDAYVNLGIALMVTGKEDESFQMFQKALEIDPDNRNVHANLAQYYCSQLNGAKAWAHIKIAQRLGLKVNEEQLTDMESICPEGR